MMSSTTPQRASTSYRDFVQEVAVRAAVAEVPAVEDTVAQLLRGLGGRLSDIDAQAVAAQLSPSLADHFLSTPPATRVGESAWPVPANADERVVRAACHLLAEMLDEQARTQLRMQPLTALFTESE